MTNQLREALRYVRFKQAQHARALARARFYRLQGRNRFHTYYLEQAARIRRVLAADLQSQ